MARAHGRLHPGQPNRNRPCAGRRGPNRPIVRPWGEGRIWLVTEATPSALGDLLARTGFSEAVRRPLAGDASTRAYERLALPDRKAILMIAPPNSESPPCPPDADDATRLALGWNASARLAASRVE